MKTDLTPPVRAGWAWIVAGVSAVAAITLYLLIPHLGLIAFNAAIGCAGVAGLALVGAVSPSIRGAAYGVATAFVGSRVSTVVLIACGATSSWLTTSSIATLSHQNPSATVAMLAHGVGATPFQYRELIPLVIRFLCAIIPLSPYTVSVYLGAVSLFAALAAFRLILGRYMSHWPAALLSPAILWALWWDHTSIGCIGLHAWYPADLPSIAFLTWGILAILRRDFRLYYLLFALATINRETSALLTVAFMAVLWSPLTRWAMAKHIAAQAAIWVAIKFVLKLAFAHNPTQMHMASHAASAAPQLFYWMAPYNFHLLTTGYLWRELPWLFAGAWLLLPLRWRSRPQEVKSLLWLAVAEFVIMWPVGLYNEPRIFDDAAVVIMLNACIAGAATLKRLGTVRSNWFRRTPLSTHPAYRQRPLKRKSHQLV